MKKESKQRYLILECRYYNGEEDNPFAHELDAHEIDKSHLPPPECMKSEYTLPPEVVSFLMNATTAWKYEKWWVEEIQDEEQTSFFESIVNEFIHFFKDFEVNDGTPIELKALLWNRYQHWLSGSPESFKEWYHEYYQAHLTNRQQRAQERRKLLIPKCRFYKGEEECPNRDNYYNMFWGYEKMWVEALSYSYKRGEKWRKDFEQAHLLLLSKKYDIPSTLLGLLYNQYMHSGNCNETIDSFNKWIVDNYIDNENIKNQ